MDQSIGPTIKKIKLQEEDMEAKLKKTREHEAALAFLNRAIRDAMISAEKSDQEQLELTKKIGKLRPQLEIEKLRRDALSAQIKKITQVLNDLRKQSDRDITNVWGLRSALCNTVQKVSDECDIWALLTRPRYTDPLPQVSTKNIEMKENIVINKDRLNAALKRREAAMAKREELQNEPETGKEFIRLKNALSYSLEKIEKYQK